VGGRRESAPVADVTGAPTAYHGGVGGARIPDSEAFGAGQPVARITAGGRPTPEFRDELRRIPDVRNGFAVAALYLQVVVIVVAAVHFDNWIVWIAAFLLMGRVDAQFHALMHEAAHRLLFRSRVANDFVGRWLLSFPAFRSIDTYRRGHMAHHRDDFRPDVPGNSLGPVEGVFVNSVRRRRARMGGSVFVKALRGTAGSERAVQARSIVGCQLVLIALGAALGHPWVYFILWLAPYLTIWRLINQLRSIAEHAGMQRSSDGRLITPAVRQTAVARFFLVPFHVGWHFAHHVDAGIPMAHLPRLHTELKHSGFVQEHLEFRNYRTLWRKLARGIPLDV
jgi:fatty acid desaturase